MLTRGRAVFAGAAMAMFGYISFCTFVLGQWEGRWGLWLSYVLSLLFGSAVALYLGLSARAIHRQWPVLCPATGRRAWWLGAFSYLAIDLTWQIWPPSEYHGVPFFLLLVVLPPSVALGMHAGAHLLRRSSG
ncbi:MAG: hypothetical protein H6707_18475 [Deltaproteobacteria bacterium]|nr:hypothetical protein [Deltaproteobacteria bacterium]